MSRYEVRAGRLWRCLQCPCDHGAMRDLKWYEFVLLLAVVGLGILSIVEIFIYDDRVMPYGTMGAGLGALCLALVFARRKRVADRERRKQGANHGK